MSWEMLGPAAIHPDPNKIRGGRPEITPDDVRLALKDLSQRPFLFGMAAFLGHRGSMDEVEVMLTQDLVCLAHRGRWGTGKDANGRPTGELTTDEIFTIERMAKLMLFEVISARSRHDTYAHEEALPAGSATVLCPACNGRGDIARPTDSGELLALEMRRQEAQDLSREAVRRSLPRLQRLALSDRHNDARLELSAAQMWPATDPCGLCEGRGRFLLTTALRAKMIGVSRPTWYRRWDEHYAEGLGIPQRWESIAIGHVRKRLRLTA